jgi:4-hydroxythreonine-4-phosphate dehydrogenase
MGDPASIGPEIAIKALLNERVQAICRPVIVGDAGIFMYTLDYLNWTATVRAISRVGDAVFQPGVINVLDMKTVDMEQFAWGEVSAMAGDRTGPGRRGRCHGYRSDQ